MRHSFPLPLVVAALLLFSLAAAAQEPIRFARLPDVSPDGKLVAFSYLGDVWIVETIGGIARPVTQHQAHDTTPVFSPDGKSIAFSSNRHGGYDVFVTSVHGGKPRRLTFDSASDQVCNWSPDGQSILFVSTRPPEFPFSPSLYSVPVAGGQERRLVHSAKDGVYSPKGNQIAYIRGEGSEYRKGYRGSSSDDLWVCNADGTKHKCLSSFAGQDQAPMWSPDGRYVYFVSEVHGTPANVVRQEVNGQKGPQLVTFHKDEGVRKARLSRDGEWIVYECGPDLYVVSTKEGSTPRKLAIEVHADDKVNQDKLTTFTTGATEFALAADEKFMAFGVHGELFMMPLGGGTTSVRLTDSPAFDHGFTWAPDSSKALFLSDRNGHEDIYLLEADDAEKPKFTEARKFKTTQLTSTHEAELGIYFSPDGKTVTFLRAGKLWAMNPDGTNQRPLVNEQQVIDYEWSPDSKWIVYARMDGYFASELYVMPAGGPTPENPARNVTRYATFNAGVTWSHNGKKLGFLSQRRQSMSLYTLALQKPAAANAPASTDIDFDDIHLRAEQAAPVAAQEGAISPDGSKVAFRTTGGSSGEDLWVASGGSLTRMTTGSVRPQQITWSKRFNDVVYFRDRNGQVRMVRTGADLLGTATRSDGDKTVLVPYKATMMVRQDEEFSEMLEQSWRALAENFYDTSFHGTDWHSVRQRYRPLVKHVAMKEDMYALINMMMGELNASHLGISGLFSSPEQFTADLGLIFDESHSGPGLKVAEVLKRGPADKRGLNVKPGDVVLSLDGTDLDGKVSVSQLLNAKKDETVALELLINPTADPKDPKARRRVEIQPTDRGQIGDLMYERWIARNAAKVGEMTGGKVGYIHIPGMDEVGLDRFVRSLYSDNFDKEAIVLDVRFNNGGFTHDQVLNYLGGKEHTLFRQRDGNLGLVLRADDRKWTKPLVLLINGRSYSDAEIFPNAFRQLGLGKLVGQPTGGAVIGTGSTRLIDGSSFKLPRIGVFTASGVNMETIGVAPDVVVENHPDQLAKGSDPQLEKSVEVVLSDVAEWKKKNPPSLVSKPTPPVAVAGPMASPTPAPTPPAGTMK